MSCDLFERTCKDNSDKALADCAIPQEMSNAEINAELGLSDASGEEDAYEGSKNYKELEFPQPLGMYYLLEFLFEQNFKTKSKLEARLFLECHLIFLIV